MVAAPLEPTPLPDRAEYDLRADVTEAFPRPAEAVPAQRVAVTPLSVAALPAPWSTRCSTSGTRR